MGGSIGHGVGGEPKRDGRGHRPGPLRAWWQLEPGLHNELDVAEQAAYRACDLGGHGVRRRDQPEAVERLLAQRATQVWAAS